MPHKPPAHTSVVTTASSTTSSPTRLTTGSSTHSPADLPADLPDSSPNGSSSRSLSGDQAETLAQEFLASQGYPLIERNYRRRFGELDLICSHGGSAQVVFVEIRYRRHDQYGGALTSIDARKQRKLWLTANAWLQRYRNDDCPARIDVIAVQPDRPSDITGGQVYQWQNYYLIWVANAIEYEA